MLIDIVKLRPLFLSVPIVIVNATARQRHRHRHRHWDMLRFIANLHRI